MIVFSAVVSAQSGVDLTNHFKKVDFRKGDTLIVGDSGVFQIRPVKKTSTAKQGSGYIVKTTTTPPPQVIYKYYPASAPIEQRPYYSVFSLVEKDTAFALVLLIVLLALVYLIFDLVYRRRHYSYPTQQPITQHFHNYGGRGGSITVDSNNEVNKENITSTKIFMRPVQPKQPDAPVQTKDAEVK